MKKHTIIVLIPTFFMIILLHTIVPEADKKSTRKQDLTPFTTLIIEPGFPSRRLGCLCLGLYEIVG